MHLSIKKQRFITYIENFTNNTGRPPTFVEIMDGLGISSLGTINWYVTELEKEGFIKRIRGSNGKRALCILEQNLGITLPLLGIVEAGYPLDTFETDERIQVASMYAKTENYALRVRGDSMQGDNIQNGDYIIVKKTNVASSGNMVIAYINNEATLKRYYLKNKQIELHPSNPDFNTIHINSKDDFRIGGIILAIIRNYT